MSSRDVVRLMRNYAVPVCHGVEAADRMSTIRTPCESHRCGSGAWSGEVLAELSSPISGHMARMTRLATVERGPTPMDGWMARHSQYARITGTRTRPEPRHTEPWDESVASEFRGRRRALTEPDSL